MLSLSALPFGPFGSGRLVTVIFLTAALAAIGGACGSGDAPQGEPGADASPSDVSQIQPGNFTKGADMKSRRERFTTVTLSDGRLFAVGGRAIGLQAQSGNYNETAELFDPVKSEWVFTSDMSEQRRSPGLFELPDGRVMVAGGMSGQRDPLASTEIWDPATGEWAPGPTMNRAHDLMGAVTLPDGRLMMIGGASKDEDGLQVSLTAESEIFDPETNTWSETAPMLERRVNQTATLLADGRVLVVGGGKVDGPYIKTAEIYDPATDAWTATPEMSRGRAFHSTTLLADGRVLVVGGRGKVRQAEIYDPATDAWGPAGETMDARSEHSAVLLADGTVLVTGGTGYLATSEIFDPATGSWVAGEPLDTGRYRHGSVRLADGRTLIMGGTSKDGMLATMEVYGGE